MEKAEQNNPNPLKIIRGRCNSAEEALEYKTELGKDHGISITISEENPRIIEIRELTHGAVGPDMFGEMNQILIDKYRRKLSQEIEAQKTINLQPSATSETPQSSVATHREDESYFSNLLHQVTSFFKPPTKPLRRSGQVEQNTV